MNDEVKRLAEVLWQNHRCKLAGMVFGLVAGIAILLFGFWNMMFVLSCGLLGLFIGVKLDKGERFPERLDRIFPNFYSLPFSISSWAVTPALSHDSSYV